MSSNAIQHDHADDKLMDLSPDNWDRQELIDHMVTVHKISPTHFRDKPEVASVRSVHNGLHNHMRDDAAYNHPQHYGGEDNPYEAIKVIAAWLGPEGVSAFCLGNALKYVSRAGKKDPAKTIEDLKKARWYLDYEIARRDEAGAAAAHDIGG